MHSRVLHLVGDGFSGFARENPDVITLTDLERLLDGEGLQEELTLVAGQGLQRERLRRIQQLAAQPRSRACLRLQSLPEPADPRLIHKQVAHNVMISTPEQVSDSHYRASLVVDDRCAEMSDHTTGQHLQGMVMLEAARQMGLAVMEQYFLPRQSRRTASFVINQLAISYLLFAFPVKTDIECQILWKGRRRLSSNEVRLSMSQGGERVLEGTAKFATYDSSLLKPFEAAKARELLMKLSSPSQEQRT